MGILIEEKQKRKNSLLIDIDSGNDLNKTSKIPIEVMSGKFTSYGESGVDMSEEQSSVGSIRNVLSTLSSLRKGMPGELLTNIGHFSGLVRLNNNTGLALCTDGVGTKILVAEMVGKYDTIGIDCIAMNVNDLICIGAEPISMVDYLAMDETKPEIAYEIAKGLREGAKQANITIAGGEIASIKEMLNGVAGKPHIDLSGMAVGIVSLDKVIDGSEISANDDIIALGSTGVHSNGLTLARKVLFNKYNVDDNLEILGTTVGEELLRPTKIYVKEVLEMIHNAEIHALAHITSHGISNLDRIGKRYNIGFSIETLPKPQPVYDLIQNDGPVTIEEMYRTFNMGMGFCIIAPKTSTDIILSIAKKHKVPASLIGETIKDKKSKVYLREYGLEIEGKKLGS